MADEFNNLPDEVKRIILLKLPIKDIVATCGANTLLGHVCDERFWQSVLELHFPRVQVIPGFTYYQTISHILTPKVIIVDVSRISTFLTITGDMTIRQLTKILSDKFSTNFPDPFASWVVVKIDGKTVKLSAWPLAKLPENSMLAAIPLSSIDNTVSKGNLFTALTQIMGKYSVHRGTSKL